MFVTRVAETILASVCASASTGRTYGRKRSGQNTAQHLARRGTRTSSARRRRMPNSSCAAADRGRDGRSAPAPLSGRGRQVFHSGCRVLSCRYHCVNATRLHNSSYGALTGYRIRPPYRPEAGRIQDNRPARTPAAVRKSISGEVALASFSPTRHRWMGGRDPIVRHAQIE